MSYLADIAHDQECASAAYALLIERTESNGNRAIAKKLRNEWRQYRNRSLQIIHEEG